MSQSIDQKVAQIRQAIYGEEVRESIASAIEEIDDIAEEAEAEAAAAVSPAKWSFGLREQTHSAATHVLTAGSTTKTITITSDANSSTDRTTKFRVADVQCYDATTKEPVIVDWAVSSIASGGSSITLTISIASAWTHNIIIYPVLSYAVAS